MSTSISPTSASPKETSPSKIDRLRMAIRRALTPPPLISVPEWADRYRRLARSAGSTAGRWRTSKVEIARGPMLAVTEPGVHTITAMVATQLLKTSLLENTIGFHAHLDPCPMLLVQPKDDASEQFSKERIEPFIKATPVLRKLIGSGKTRNADDTITYKTFPGGFLAIAGAGSPDNLARRPVRIVAYDEIDKYPVTREGKAVALGDERMATFDVNWLSMRVCSPTIEGESDIEASYLASDQRKASVACPHCGHRQFLGFFTHVKWDQDPAEAAIQCDACGVLWTEAERLAALQTARWHQTRAFDCCGARHQPLELYELAWRSEHNGPVDEIWDWWESPRHAVYRAKCPTCGRWAVSNEHAGFQAGKLYSPWAKDHPARIAKKWIDAKGDEDLKQVWWNTQEGLAFRRNTVKELKLETLAARCEIWPAEVPDGVAVVTCGIDVQDYRVEIETVGWGRNEESWSIDYEVIDGEFDDPQTRKQVDAYLKRIWRRSDGRGFEIAATCIDSGGHHTNAVYDFAKARLGRRVWAIKGESARTGQRNPVWPVKRPTSRTKKSFRPVILGVNAAKDTIRSRLMLPGPGPGYMHYPSDRDINYFAQMTAERLTIRKVAGQKFRVWELPPGKANEALDCRVYAYGALCGLLHFGLKLNRRADEIVPANAANATGTAPAAGSKATDGPTRRRARTNEPPPGQIDDPSPAAPGGGKVTVTQAAAPAKPKRRSLADRLA